MGALQELVGKVQGIRPGVKSYVLKKMLERCRMKNAVAFYQWRQIHRGMDIDTDMI